MPALEAHIGRLRPVPTWRVTHRPLRVACQRGGASRVLLPITLIGTTITSHMQVFLQAAVVERGATPEDLRLRARRAIEPILDELPRVAFRNAKAAGTDIYGYMTELFGFTAFALEEGTVYQTYSTTGRGVEFLMPYCGFLEGAPGGLDEGEGWQLWIHRHDEYGGT